MTHPISKLTRALHFAAQRHSTQRRKGAAKEPYINHCIEVAHLVAVATDGTDTAQIVAAVLHDTVEDTEATHAELEEQFGADIAGLVVELTDDKSLTKAERKRLQIEKTPQKSDRAKMIKLADKTSNLRALVTSPPPDWDDARREEYFEWARRVVAGCRGVNEALEAGFDEAYRAGVE